MLMASVWIRTRPTKDGGKRYRLEYRLGGRESRSHYGGSFRTMREAKIRRDWIAGELAALRVPDLARLRDPAPSPTLAEAARRWQESRVDIADATRLQHRTALRKALPALGTRRVGAISPQDLADLVARLNSEGGQARVHPQGRERRRDGARPRRRRAEPRSRPRACPASA
jgi:hypothetical protein